MRIFQCEDGLLKGPTQRVPDKACVFCERCTDIFWDYSHGVYCIFCDKHEDDNYVKHGNSDSSCPDFIEEKEVIK